MYIHGYIHIYTYMSIGQDPRVQNLHELYLDIIWPGQAPYALPRKARVA